MKERSKEGQARVRNGVLPGPGRTRRGPQGPIVETTETVALPSSHPL